MTEPSDDTQAAGLAGFHLAECLLMFLVTRGVINLPDTVTVVGNALFAMNESAKRHPERGDPVKSATDMLMGTLRRLTHLDENSIVGRAKQNGATEPVRST